MKFTWHYRCRHCATWAITAKDSGAWVRCNGCGGAKTFQFRSNALKPDELEAWNYAKEHGVAHLPLPGSMPMAPFTCTRCGEDFPEDAPRHYRNGRRCCDACYHAESRSLMESIRAANAQRAAVGSTGE